MLKLAGVLRNEEGSYIANRKISDAILKTLKGEPGTLVDVTVYRRSTNQVLKFPISRGEVAIKSVSASNMITPTSGVLIGVLGVARIPFEKWVKWVFPFIAILVILGLILLM